MEIKGKLEDILNKFNSRLEHVEKKLDTLDSDRSIFENIQGRLTSLEEQWRMTREHDVEVKKDLKEEINAVGDKTAQKVETGIKKIQNSIEKGKIREIKRGLFQRIKEKLRG